MFQKGDKVICVEGSGQKLILGKVYTIDQPSRDNKLESIVYIQERDDGCNGWYNRRFKLFVEEKKTYKLLYAEAKALKIVNRSKMNKAGLEKAVQLAKDKPIPPPIPKFELSLEEELRKRTGNIPGICSYAKEFEDKYRSFHVSDICHARLPFYTNKRCSALACDVQGHYNNHPQKKEYKKWIDYMLNRSPWSSCFKTKDVEEAMKTAVLMNVDEGFSRVCCAAIALRLGSEFPNKVKTFDWLVNKGFSENTSLFIAIRFVLNNDSWEKASINRGHDVFNASQNIEQVIKFFREGFHIPEETSFRNGGGKSYSIFHSIAKFDDFGMGCLSGWFIDNFIATERVVKLWEDVFGLKDEDVIKAAQKASAIIDIPMVLRKVA